MAREEVKYASKDYVNYLLDKQEYHNEKYTEYDIKQAFEKGAEWADNHPINVWHDASGKNRQFSDSDRKTAENFGIDYMDVEDFVNTNLED